MTQTATPITDALLNDTFTMKRPATIETERYQTQRFIDLARKLESDLANARADYLRQRQDNSRLSAANAGLAEQINQGMPSTTVQS